MSKRPLPNSSEKLLQRKSQRYFTRGSASPQEAATKKKPFPKIIDSIQGKTTIKLKKYSFSDLKKKKKKKKKKDMHIKMVTGRVE